jgi:perosamine synthetase
MSMPPEPVRPPTEGGGEVIPLSIPHLGGNEWAYLKECLDTNMVSSVGPFVDRFERELAARVGLPHAVATTSGTAALHVALLVAGVRPGDEVLVSTLSFIAPANAVRYCGAWPVFCDAEASYWQMDVERVERFIRNDCLWQQGSLTNRRTGRPVRALLPVHILGHPVDLDPLVALAEQYGLAVVEDATESLGATYRGRPVGSVGHLACFSFNGNKLVTSGGGGMIVTQDRELATRARYLTTQAKDDPVEFVHGAIGYNYRLTNIQAAVGCAQLEKLDDHVAAKLRIAELYREGLEGLPGLSVMPEASWATSVFWLYTILVDGAEYGADSRAAMAHLRGRGIEARPLWQPLHRSPAHEGATAGGCSVAERLSEMALSLPSSVSLTEEQQSRVVDELHALHEGKRVSPARVGR